MNKLVRVCMHSVWILSALLIITFFSPGIYTAVIVVLALFTLSIWVVFGNLEDIDTKTMNDVIGLEHLNTDTVRNICSERKKIELKQKSLRIAGSALIVVCFPCYIIIMHTDNQNAAAIPLILIAGGMYLLLFSFKYYKFVALKLKPKSNSQPISGTPSAHTVGVKPSSPAKKDLTQNDKNSKISGCLIGGAAGDALGYPVEFKSYEQITELYGKSGITSYCVDDSTNKALISDDTQMTLFTAEGLTKVDGNKTENIYETYLRWFETQNKPYCDSNITDSELMKHKELFAKRAPGNTCLSALSTGIMGTVQEPINSSKGCGGVMRVAPIAFLGTYNSLERDKLAIQAAAITHGHPLGYLSAALLVHILNKCIFIEKGNLSQIIDKSIDEFYELFSAAPFIEELIDIVKKAQELSKNMASDIKNISELGEGWVAEEALAVSIYCALRYQNDFSKGIIAAVNHSGDSDSTGAITGNILGAYLGEEKIDENWKEHLELFDLIKTTANRFYLS